MKNTTTNPARPLTLDDDTLADMAHAYVDAHDRWASTRVGHRSNAALIRRMERLSERAERAGRLADFVNTTDSLFRNR